MSDRSKPVALVLGGGGILGAAYEVGVLAAFEDRYGEGAVYRNFDVFVGTSAGSFVAALVGQGIAPGRIYRAFLEQDASLFIRPKDVYRLDWRRLARGAMTLSWALARAVASSFARDQRSPFLDTLFSGLERLPAGFLKVSPLESYLRRIFEQQGLTNSFRDLPKPILIPSVDLDRGERWIFGAAPETDPAISQAVTASSAIPRLFGPVLVGSRFFVDGGIGGAAHLDVAAERGAEAVVFINPVVASCLATPPNPDRAEPPCECRPVSQGGYGAVLDQCKKLELEADVKTAVEAARARYVGVDFLLIQPDRREMLPEGTMHYSVHRKVLEQGFRGLDNLDAETLRSLGALLGQPDPSNTLSRVCA